MKTAEKSARTIEEAIAACLAELGGVSKDEVTLEVLEEPGKGLFGLFGNKQAKVRATLIEETEMNPPPAQKTEEEALSPAEKTALNEQRAEIARTFLFDLLEAMDIRAEIEIVYHEDNVHININGQDIGILIGRRGDTLDALQFLTNLAVSRRTAARSRVLLDVAGYRKRREDALTGLARRLADKVKRTNIRVTLEPMSPHERRIIHTALQNEWRLTTFSEGDEPNRRVVIAPKRSGTRPE
ncbi:MAG: protein jag [Gracilibacteraceae bacterium]|jgi:spoIIIJ-associated protein|nr:protein jag [Gracilibacteraceae bacterium]